LPDTPKIEPLHLQGLSDYHCHCDYSVDAVGTVDEYCDAAIRRGLAEICFTTHYDFNPRSDRQANFIVVRGDKRPTGPESLAPYVKDVRRAADRFLPEGLSVKLGVEFGWFPGCQEDVRAVIDRFSIEYALCGIHELDNICLCCRAHVERCFSRFSVEEAVEAYTAHVIQAAKSGLFDTIAHLDYVRRYGLDYYGPSLDSVFESRLPDIFGALRSSGTALEINTAGLRHGVKSYYPKMNVVNAATRSGVAVQYIGSDAHRPDQVGFDFDGAGALVAGSIGWCDDL